MSSIQFIYSGSDTRKITRLNNDPVIISGDSNSTTFSFKFPESHKGYKKTIEWDFWMKDPEGNLMNPSYPLVNDEHIIPGDVTYFNSGKQVGFSLVFERDDDPLFRERSTIYPIYVSKGVKRTKTAPSVSIYDTLKEEAYITSSYDVNTGEDRPEITFSSYNGTVYTLLLDMPYLNTLGKIPAQFFDMDQIVSIFEVESYEDMSVLEAVSPDMAIITEGDKKGDIYILVGEDATVLDDWAPIYSQSGLDSKLDDTQLIVEWMEEPSDSNIPSEKLVKDTLSDMSDDISSRIEAHTSDVDNPHSVTKAQVGLGIVENIAPLDMPISTATQQALDSNHEYSSTHIADTTNPHAVTKAQVGLGVVEDIAPLDMPISTATQQALDSNYEYTTTHIEDEDNPHSVTKAQVGLGNADNTSDINKPISIATQQALDSAEQAFDSHRDDDSNPHSVTKAQVGLGVVEDIAPLDMPISTATQQALDSNREYSSTHIADTTNPHSVTKAQVGLGNVDNTSDINKPISTATQQALDSNREYSSTHIADTTNPHSVTKAQVGLGNADNTSDIDKPISTATQQALDSNYEYTTTHIEDEDNPHSVTKAQVGLGNADNTSDINKPISTATQSALDAKQPNLTGGATTIASANLTSSRALISNSSGKVAVCPVTATELGYVDGVTSPIQSQIDTKVTKTGAESIGGVKTFTDNVNVGLVGTPKQLSLVGDLNIQGNITQNGTAYEVHTEQIHTKDDKIIMRDGATAGLLAGDSSGFTFKKYDGTNDGELSVDSSGTARVGDVGNLQPLATRNESEDMGDGLPVVWDADDLKMITKALDPGDIPELDASKITSGTIEDARIPAGITRDTELSAHTSLVNNPHAVTKAQVGLGSVDNTSDVGKPISTATQTVLNAKADTSALTGHTGNESNPHKVTKAQVGLGDADNTSDTAKPISTATQTALNAKQDKLTFDSAPVQDSDNPVKSGGIYDALQVIDGKVGTHEARKDNPHAVTKAQVGLGNVDNTSDANKPVSTATNTELAKKVAIAQGSGNASKFALTDASGDLNTFRTLTATDIPNLNASIIAAGTLVDARIPTTIARSTEVTAHTGRTDNPHAVTKEQVGLGAYPTLPADIGISTATQTALDEKQDKLTFDDAPIDGSDNPVKSGGIYDALQTVEAEVGAHVARKDNPHSVTKAQIGLGSVNNTSDVNKPISTATQTALNAKADTSALDGYVPTTRKVNGKPLSADIALTFADVGALSADTHIPEGSVVDPDFSETSLNPIQNKVLTARLKTLATKAEIEAHTSNTSNPHGVTKADVGLGNVDDTSDLDKPVSTAQAQAIGQKADTSSLTGHTGNVSNPHKVTKAQVGLGAYPTNPSDIDISAATQNALNAKQDKLTFDNTPAYNSDNPVKSRGIYDALTEKADAQEVQDYVFGVVGLLNDKQNKLTFDNAPVQDSDNPVKSGGIYDALNTGISSHANKKDNPHSVTKAQVGLSNVDNTSDIAKPISTATQTALDTLNTGISSHANKKDNPHAVTKAQVGLGNVNNTSDTAKPISTATQTALDGKAEKASTESHINNKANPHSVTKAQVGLEFADNTTDADKPISTATQTALNLKANDSAVVHKSGNETINGIKTFYNNLNIGTASTPAQMALKGNLVIEGNIVQNGSAYEVHAESVNTTNDKITMRDGAIAGLGVGQTSGFTFKKYDGTYDGELAVDSLGTARVGDVGDLQPLATRNEAELMTNNQPVVWDSSGLKMVTRALDAGDIPNLDAGKIKSGTIDDERIPSGITRDTELTAHTSRTDNPHGVTKAQVGLGNVNNTSDVNKPISTATQTALNAKADITYVDTEIANIPEVDISGKADKTYVDTKLDKKADITYVDTEIASIPEVDISGKADKTYVDGELDKKADASALTGHTGNKSNPHSVTKAQIGLGNVDNTSDLAKPISTAVQTALNAKQNKLTFATEAQAIAGTNNTTMMSPLRVDQAFNEKFKVIDGMLNVFENGEWVEYVKK